MSGVELLVGLLIPETPEADVWLDTEVMERRRAAIAELGGLTVFSVKRAFFRVAGAAGDITSEGSIFVLRVDNANELRLLALFALITALSFLLPTTEATERTELGRGGGGPMGVLFCEGAKESLREITLETPVPSVVPRTFNFRLICIIILSPVFQVTINQCALPDPIPAAWLEARFLSLPCLPCLSHVLFAAEVFQPRYPHSCLSTLQKPRGTVVESPQVEMLDRLHSIITTKVMANSIET